jgi:hypothetical protein
MGAVDVALSSLCLFPAPNAVLQLFGKCEDVWIVLRTFRDKLADLRQILRIEDGGYWLLLQDL